MKARLPFFLSLWMAMLVALVSALAPLGPPSSRPTGSAFNPATTSVLIKAGDRSAAPVERAREPDDRDKRAIHGSAMAWLLPLTMLLFGLVPGSRSRPPLPFLSSSAWRAEHLPRRHARAPPSLS